MGILGFPFWESDMVLGYPPPPSRSNGIIKLAENLEIISGAQSLAGKILSHKDLSPVDLFPSMPLSPWQSCASSLLCARADITSQACGFLWPIEFPTPFGIFSLATCQQCQQRTSRIWLKVCKLSPDERKRGCRDWESRHPRSFKADCSSLLPAGFSSQIQGLGNRPTVPFCNGFVTQSFS